MVKSHLSPAEENNEVPDGKEKTRFNYRHNSPYRRQPRPGDFGVRRSTPPPPSTTTTQPPPGYHSNLGYHPASTQAPAPGPFVTPAPKRPENVTMARQPKLASFNDYRAGSNRHEVRVLPPDEFHHLLARVDGVGKKVTSALFSFHLVHLTLQEESDSLPSESRRRTRKGKFQGVPGIAGRDFPTLGSIPMTRSVFFCDCGGFLIGRVIVLVSHASGPRQVSTLTWKQTVR